MSATFQWFLKIFRYLIQIIIAKQQSRVQSFVIKILQINAATNVEAKFQIFSKIHGAHKEFMIAPRLSEMHRALGEASAPNKRISGKQEKFGELDFAT